MLKFLFFLPALLLSTSLLVAQGRCVSGDCYSGRGKYKLADGATYEGTFKRGKFEGTGVLIYPDGSKYIGDFHNQLQEGKGRLKSNEGNFFGMWHLGRRHGPGTMTYTNGNEVKGKWVDGYLQGEVEFSFGNDDFYRGAMVAGQFAGYGTMQYANGDLYEGQWRGNRPHGEGKFTFADGGKISGQWADGNYQANWAGLGNSITMADGSIYRGGYGERGPQGLGVMTTTDGRVTGGYFSGGRLYRKLYESSTEPLVAKATDFDPEVKVWAVVVGVAYYQHMRTLRYTDDDAYQLYAFLRSVEGGALPTDQVKVLIDEQATYANILGAMRDVYRRADENDVILFYFSGHGLPGSFLPVDYDGQVNLLAHEDIHDALLASRSKHKLVIADACHSGSLASRSGGSGGALDSYYQALNNARASTALLLSSKGPEISLEDGKMRSGVFSHYLIRGMQGEADANGDRLIGIRELYDYVHRQVRSYTGNVQTPTLTGVFDENLPVAVIRGR